MFIPISISFHRASLLSRIFFPRFLQDGKFLTIYQNADQMPHPQQLAEFRGLQMGVTSFLPILDIWYLQVSLFIKSFLCQHTILHLSLLTQNLTCHNFSSLSTSMFLLHKHSHQHEKFNYFFYNYLKESSFDLTSSPVITTLPLL